MSESPSLNDSPEVSEALTVAESLDQLKAADAQVPVVAMVNVSKWFYDADKKKRVDVLKDLNFQIEASEERRFVVLLGPSGCGKSTILSLLSGLALPDSGEILLKGKPVTGPADDSATVPQAYTCYPWWTVLKNVEFGLTLQGRGEKERREIAMDYLKKVGLEDRARSYPKQLSGGMQQRVAIARTLAIKPPIVLMDEPFGALDAQTRSEMQQMILKLWESEKNTIVFVTHDITEALLLGDRVIVFPSRPIKGGTFHDERDLDKRFGHYRPPELVREKEFIELAEELRQVLRNKMMEDRDSIMR